MVKRITKQPVPQQQENNCTEEPFNQDEPTQLKRSGKAAEPDDIYRTAEEFWTRNPWMVTQVLKWMYETDADTKVLTQIPNNSHNETGETTQWSKNYRPVALLCHTYKIYERLILNRITAEIDKKN